MERFDDTSSNKELSHKELQELLDQSYSWVQKILKEHAGEEDSDSATIPLTTTQADDRDTFGALSIKNINGSLHIQLNQTTYPDAADEAHTTEHFLLTFNANGSDYALFATGTQTDSISETLALKIRATETYHTQQFHEASTTEVRRLAEIVELGAFGDEHFDFEDFAQQYKQHIDEQNKNNPE